MLSQTCIHFFHVPNTKDDIEERGKPNICWSTLTDRRNQCVNVKNNVEVIYVQQKKETHSGVKLILSE